MKGLAIGAAIVIAVVIAVQVFTAQGAPSQPTVALESSLTPGAAQTVTFVVSSNVYSFQPPNSIDLLGAKAQYSVWQNNATVVNGGTSSLAVSASSGDLYTMTTTIQVTLGSICSGAACSSSQDKVAIHAVALVSTYDGLYQSPSVNYTFQPGVPPVVTQGSASPASAPDATYLINTLGAVLAGSALLLFIAYAAGPRLWAEPVIAVLALVALAALFAFRAINGG